MGKMAIITLDTIRGPRKVEIKASDTIQESCEKTEAILKVVAKWFREGKDSGIITRLFRYTALSDADDLFISVVKIIEGE